MHIQWFPGHMTKAMRMMEENVKLCDGIIYVLDARAAFACINNKLIKVFEGKPIVYVLNKCDLADKTATLAITKKFASQNKIVVAIDGKEKGGATEIYNKCLLVTAEKREHNKKKGFFAPVRFMVAGIPNTGKSTIINTMSGEKHAVTGDKAGVTKGKQWIKLDDIELLDTPGTMPPSFANQTYAEHLAYLGSINDVILDTEELTLDLIKELVSLYPNLVTEKYGITDFTLSPLQMYDEICKKRGFLQKGGSYDYERCANAVIDDLRKCRIGRISFER